MATSLYIDDQIKKKASEKAKSNHLSFSAVVRILLTDYVSGKIVIGAQTVENYKSEEVSVDSKTQSKMDNISKLWNNRKN